MIGEARSGAEGPDGSREEQAEVAYLTGVGCYTISRRSRPHRPSSAGRSSSWTRRTSRTTGCAWTSTSGDRAAIGASATGRQRARTSTTRSSSVTRSRDVHRSAEVNLQASLVAERQGHWVLARRYAEASRDAFQAVGDTVTMGRVLNNLGGLNHSLGNDEVAIGQLREAFAIFVDAHLDPEAGYVLSSLAEIHRERGDLEEAEVAARRALELLEGRIDHVQEIGTAQLVLARAHLEQGELDQADDLLAAVDESYALTESVSHQARSWMATRRARAAPPERRRSRSPVPRSGNSTPADRPVELDPTRARTPVWGKTRLAQSPTTEGPGTGPSSDDG